MMNLLSLKEKTQSSIKVMGQNEECVNLTCRDYPSLRIMFLSRIINIDIRKAGLALVLIRMG